MTSGKYMLIRLGLEALAMSGLPFLTRALSRCKGTILTLHRVVPERPADFSPNAILQITPAFLEQAIVRVRALGFDIVSMDEAMERLGSTKRTKRFVVFSFDDAYRDNLTHALPILRKHNCPFTLYVPTAFVDGVGVVWWQALEDIIAQTDALALPNKKDISYLDTKSPAQKEQAFTQLYSKMRALPEVERLTFIGELAWRAGLDLGAHCRDLIMNWAELKTFVDEPLCTIGAHTVSHPELSLLEPDKMKAEMEQSISILQAQTGIIPRHFSYPIGSRVAAGPREYTAAKDIGFRTGVTTIPGGLYARHFGQSHALPRVSLNGNFQSRRFIDVFLTGAFFTSIAPR